MAPQLSFYPLAPGQPKPPRYGSNSPYLPPGYGPATGPLAGSHALGMPPIDLLYEPVTFQANFRTKPRSGGHLRAQIRHRGRPRRRFALRGTISANASDSASLPLEWGGTQTARGIPIPSPMPKAGFAIAVPSQTRPTTSAFGGEFLSSAFSAPPTVAPTQ